MAQQQQTSTGASNVEYDLVSEMHTLLKGNAALEKYIEDAKGAGDEEVERCFTQIRETNRQHVSLIEPLLSKWLSRVA